MQLDITFTRLTIGLVIAMVFFVIGLVCGIAITLFLTVFPQWKKRLELFKFIIQHKKDIEAMMGEDKEEEE